MTPRSNVISVLVSMCLCACLLDSMSLESLVPTSSNFLCMYCTSFSWMTYFSTSMDHNHPLVACWDRSTGSVVVATSYAGQCPCSVVLVVSCPRWSQDQRSFLCKGCGVSDAQLPCAFDCWQMALKHKMKGNNGNHYKTSVKRRVTDHKIGSNSPFACWIMFCSSQINVRLSRWGRGRRRQSTWACWRILRWARGRPTRPSSLCCRTTTRINTQH